MHAHLAMYRQWACMHVVRRAALAMHKASGTRQGHACARRTFRCAASHALGARKHSGKMEKATKQQSNKAAKHHKATKPQSNKVFTCTGYNTRYTTRSVIVRRGLSCLKRRRHNLPIDLISTRSFSSYPLQRIAMYASSQRATHRGHGNTQI